MKLIHVALGLVVAVGLSGASCMSPSDTGGGSGGQPSASGGANGSGGKGSGGSDGSGSGGSGSGGKSSSGGADGTGGKGSGGSGTGGEGTGGASSGGTKGSGGSSTGGVHGDGGVMGASGGAAGRGAASGGRGGGSTGTNSGGAGGGSSSGSGFSAVATLLGASCGTGKCHDGSVHVDLRNTTGLYNRIVNATAGAPMTMTNCKKLKLVVPNDAAGSLISQIVKAPVTDCGKSRMPDDCVTTTPVPAMGRACLTSPQISTIDSWIAAGAPM